MLTIWNTGRKTKKVSQHVKLYYRSFFREIEKSILKFTWKQKRPKQPKQSWTKRIMPEVLPAFKLQQK
jgi:hypothetical protein